MNRLEPIWQKMATIKQPFDVTKRIFQEYVKNWTDRRNAILAHGKWTEQNVTYVMHFRRFIDWSLIYDDDIFYYKPPKILLILWCSGIGTVQKFLNELIDKEIVYAKQPGGVTDLELIHIINLKSIAYWVLKNKYPTMDISDRRRLISGDFRRPRHVVNNYAPSVTAL